MFITGTVRRWFAVVGTVLTFVGIGTFALSARHEWAWLAIGGLACLVLALGWQVRDERSSRLLAENRAVATKTDPRRQWLAELLGEQANGAQDLLAEFMAKPETRAAVQARLMPWEEATYDLIVAALGSGEGHVFRVGHAGERPAPQVPWPVSVYIERSQRLADLIVRLSQLTLKDDWQP